MTGRPAPAPLSYLVAAVLLLSFARWTHEHVPEPLIDERHLGSWVPTDGAGQMHFTLGEDAFGYDTHHGTFVMRGVPGWPDAEGTWSFVRLVPLRLRVVLPDGPVVVEVHHATADTMSMRVIEGPATAPPVELLRAP